MELSDGSAGTLLELSVGTGGARAVLVDGAGGTTDGFVAGTEGTSGEISSGSIGRLSRGGGVPVEEFPTGTGGTGRSWAIRPVGMHSDKATRIPSEWFLFKETSHT
jgi:hypothetical protein